MLALGMMTGSRQVFDLTISSNRATWQRSVDATQIPSTSPVLLILRIASGIQVQSTSTSSAAIIVDDLADGSEFFFFNSGYAIGDGGDGGIAGADSAGTAGGPGGDAVFLDFNGYAEIMNGSGRIWGGGGGGGGGGSSVGLSDGGDGGGGAGGGAAGGSGATAGTSGSAGAAGTGETAAGGDGGNGGAYGAAGSNGSSQGYSGGVGGAAGYAVRHLSGTTVNFVAGQTDPNVKGSIGT